MRAFPEPLASIYLFSVGLVLGSFLNVCIVRLPLGQSVVRPASRCPSCRNPIRWYHNVPVVSWLWLRGRCASCAARISPRYPFIELMSGAFVLAMWLAFGATPAFPVAAVFALALVALFFTDLDHQLLPDAITLTGVVAGLALAWFNPFLTGYGWARVWASFSGAALGSGLLWGIGAVYGRLRGVEAMGMGDVKMMGMVGAFTGPFGVLFTIFGASAVGAVVGLLLIPLKGRSLQDTLPFGCFLAPASLAALLMGRQFADAYLRLLMPGP
jgi:leader peptidase (prepilin peptidase)/N-methyltransferase